MRGKYIKIEDLLKDYIPDPDQHAVFVCLQFPIGALEKKSRLDAVFDLDDVLMTIVEKTNVGNYDGHEFCEAPDEESVTFFMYGPDADKIYEAICPVLLFLPKLPGSYVLKRYGNYERVREEKIYL